MSLRNRTTQNVLQGGHKGGGRPMRDKAFPPAVEMLESRTLLSDSYTITDLGLGAAYGINATGQVVARIDTNISLYGNGTTTDLGSVPGGRSGLPYGINSSGQVAGLSYVGQRWHAFLYTNGNMIDLGTLPGGVYSTANGINDSGQVVGASNSGTSRQNYRPFLYSDGVMTDLGTLGGSGGSAASINNKGQIAGSAGRSDYNLHAYIYDAGTMTDLGTLGGSESFASHINEAGQVVGHADKPTWPGSDAFLFSAGKMIDLGVLPGYTYQSSALCINDGGEIVGWSKTSSDASHAFLYTNGTMIDLNSLIDPSSGWTLNQASAINDSGQIVGSGTNAMGEVRAFLLTPKLAPTSLALSVRSVAENMPAATVVGRFSTIDRNIGETFAYSLVDGAGSADNAVFKMATNGRLKTTQSFDFETKSRYRIRVRSTDHDGLFCEKAITIKVADVNEWPTGITFGRHALRDDQSVVGRVGQLIGADPDAGGTLTYTLVDGAGARDNARFAIWGTTLRPASFFSYSPKSDYKIRVRVTDQDGLWYEKPIRVGVIL